MNEIIMNEVDLIIRMLEDKEYNAYSYIGDSDDMLKEFEKSKRKSMKNKFHIVDEEKQIDFQAKLANNNYYVSDNFRGLTYMKTKKYISKKTAIVQIIMEKKNDKFYLAFLDSDEGSYVKMLRLIRSSGNDVLDCKNVAVDGCSWDELLYYIEEYEDEVKGNDLQYSANNDESEKEGVDIIVGSGNVDSKNEGFVESEINENITLSKEYPGTEIYSIDEDEFDNGESDEEYDKNNFVSDEKYDEEYIEDEYEYDEQDDYGDFEEDDYDEIDELEEDLDCDYEYEFNQIDENMELGLSDVFEDNTIDEYLVYVDSKIQNEESKNNPVDEEYEEALKDYFDDYELKINGEIFEGHAKYKIVTDCEVCIENNACNSFIVDQAVINLKTVINEVQKAEEEEREL